MQKESSDKWVCDCCGKEETTHSGDIPVGWFSVTFIQMPAADFSPQMLIPVNLKAEEWEVCSKECLVRTVTKTGELISEAKPEVMSLINVKQQEAEPASTDDKDSPLPSPQ